jgi:hypothetical protein
MASLIRLTLWAWVMGAVIGTAVYFLLLYLG